MAKPVGLTFIIYVTSSIFLTSRNSAHASLILILRFVPFIRVSANGSVIRRVRQEHYISIKTDAISDTSM